MAKLGRCASVFWRTELLTSICKMSSLHNTNFVYVVRKHGAMRRVVGSVSTGKRFQMRQRLPALFLRRIFDR